MNLVYIDVLKMVAPIEKLEDSSYDFFLLGNFDAMKINTKLATIEALQAEHRRRYSEIPPYFERQPLYLYARERVDDDIFQRSIVKNDAEERINYSYLPLVLTLFQIDDFGLINKDNPDEIITAFEDKIKAELCKLKENTPDLFLKFQVFWNLGESDVVVIFRSNRMKAIGQLLFNMRSWENVSEGICVLSTSSHCAFPNSKRIKRNFKKWLEIDKSFELTTLANTSYGLRDIGDLEGKKSFLFGEWDNLVNWPNTPEERASFFYTRIVESIKKPNPQKPMPFRTAYTLPSIELEASDFAGVSSANKRAISQIPQVYPEVTWLSQMDPSIEKDNAFNKLKKCVESMKELFGESFDAIAQTIYSLGNTTAGLAKHLYRLLTGRFQGDLYAFVKPVFEASVELTFDMSDRLEGMHAAYKNSFDDKERDRCLKHISRLIDDYIHDVSRILSQLQHLFSVLSVSPHTFLETYGSNMRSMAAACKLVIAYQGITYLLGEAFSGELMVNGKLIKTKKVSMVLPYRKITSSNRLLFPFTTPKSRLFYIQIDFMDMLNIPRALLVLLHECGHQLIWCELREKCARSYCRAVIARVLEHELQSQYMDLSTSIPEPLKSKSQYKDYRVSVNSATLLEGEQLVKEALNTATKKLFQVFWNEYDKYQKDNSRIYDPISMENYEFYYVKECIENYLNNITKPDNWRDQNFNSVINDIFHVYALIIKDIEQSGSYKDRLDRREIIFLEQYYEVRSDLEEYQSRINTLSEVIRASICSNYAAISNELNEVYEDIYSDLLSLNLLGLSGGRSATKHAKEYLKQLLYMAGAIRDEIILETSKLVRISAVLCQCYGIKSIPQIVQLFREAKLSTKTCKSVENELRKIERSLYFEEILDFASDCQKKIKKELEDNDTLKEISKMLKKMYSNASSSTNDLENPEIIRGIYYFWKESTKRIYG